MYDDMVKLIEYCQNQRNTLSEVESEKSYTGRTPHWMGDGAHPTAMLTSLGNRLAEVRCDTTLTRSVLEVAEQFSPPRAIAVLAEVEDWCRATAIRTFQPTAKQEEILRALTGKAMTKQELGDELFKGDGSALYSNSDFSQLRQLGFVEHRSGRGFYRPDAPPKGIMIRNDE